ncbi:MAG: DNA-directed RNA polymerase subunit H [Candidatus Aenigmatarchaeota archaeon]
MATKKDDEEKEIAVLKHHLVPEHVILNEQEIAEIMKKYNITVQQLPKIFSTDPAVKAIGAKEGQVLKITRNSPTAGTAVYYRIVVKD